MKANLLLTPKQVLDLSKPRKKKNEKLEWSWTEKISGGRGKKAMKKIVQGVEKLKETQDSGETQKNPEEIEPDFSKVRGRESMRRVLEGIGKLEETQDAGRPRKTQERLSLFFR